MKQPPAERAVSNLLLGAVADGEWAARAVAARMARACGERRAFLRTFAARVIAAFPERPPVTALAVFTDADDGFRRGTARRPLGVREIFVLRPVMAASPWPVPALATPAALAEWLVIGGRALDWFADAAGLNESQKLRHYTVRWLPKSGGKDRLLEVPKRRLKAIQRHVLRDLLSHIPPHPAAHAYHPGRNVVSYAAPHAGKAIVLRFDLADFFPSVTRARVEAIFRTAGYPEGVARILAGLCTTRLPRAEWDARPRPADDGRDHATWQRLAQAHLPQGAPTSPHLANLAAYRLDVRLTALAAAAGATYTRYADDLAFSGGDELARGWKRFQTGVVVIAIEEGFALNFRKTRAMRPGHRQHLAGVVVNARPNLKRDDFDRLKAVLTNCARHGPAGQNRDGRTDFRAYLAGKVAHAAMLNPDRGAKLRLIFGQIAW